MPRLWNDTIDAHRRDVTEAILDKTAELVGAHGLRSVTMSQVAEHVGIGRATLYKYFPNVDAILAAWHHRQVTAHLEQLAAVAERPAPTGERLAEVLHHYAAILHDNHNGELAAVLHQGDHLDAAHDRLHQLVTELIASAAAEGTVRSDVAPRELATFCLHAVDAANDLPSKAAVRRLVAVTTDALRPD